MSKTIQTIDLDFQGIPQTIASYAIETSDGIVLVETGPGSSVQNAARKLNVLGIAVTDVRHVFVTHIHLDHAGAAGWWAQKGAHIYVHRIGLPHLIDPSRLLHSAGRIYGDQMDSLWGTMLPIDPEQITAMNDGDTFDIGDICITAWDTPGHAWHHMTLLLDDIAFTGDVGGVRLPECDWISLPAPPPEFKLDAWLKSLDRIESAEFRCIYPTHFGPFTDVADHLHRLRSILLDSAEFVRQRMLAGDEREQILTHYTQRNQARADEFGLAPATYAAYEIANPLYMSVDGIMRYWRKKGV